MIRFALRCLGYALIAVGFTLLVIDGTGSIASGAFSVTMSDDALAKTFPGALADMRRAIEGHLGAPVRAGVEIGLHHLPAFLVVMVLGLSSIVLGRRPTRMLGFAPLG